MLPIEWLPVQRRTCHIIWERITPCDGDTREGTIVQTGWSLDVVDSNGRLTKNSSRFRLLLRIHVEEPEHDRLEVGTACRPTIRHWDNAVLLFGIWRVEGGCILAALGRSGLDGVVPATWSVQGERSRCCAADCSVDTNRIDHHWAIQNGIRGKLVWFSISKYAGDEANQTHNELCGSPGT